MNFEAYVNDIVENRRNVFGIEVYENGVLTHSYGDTTEQIHDLYSATKSIVSLAVGIAYDRGLIDLERSVLGYLPKKYVDRMSDQQKATYEKITVRRLLTMSIDGMPFCALAGECEDYLEFTLSCDLLNPDVQVFNYSNLNTYLICVALTEILGMDLGKFIEEEIFKPLGITHFDYHRSPEGYFYGASASKLSVHDLSKIGRLCINYGTYEGKRIVSEEYMHMATSVQQMNREGGYGFFFWKYRDGFSINGKCGQKCYCLPQEGILVTFLSYIEGDTSDLTIGMEQHILDDKN